MFSPLTLPLVGRVGDTGDMEDLVEDDHVAFLKSRIGDDWDKFLEGVCYGGHHPKIDSITKKVNRHRSRFGKEASRYRWDGNLSGCWISKPAFDYFSTRSWDDWGKPNLVVADDGWLNPYNLKGMGFSLGPKDPETAIAILGPDYHDGQRHQDPWTHPQIPGLVLWCDGSMSSQGSYNGKKLNIGYVFRDLVKALKKINVCLPDETLKWAKSTSVYRKYLVNARENDARFRKFNREHRERLESNPRERFSLISEPSLLDGPDGSKVLEQTVSDGRWIINLHTNEGSDVAGAWEIFRSPKIVPENISFMFRKGLEFPEQLWEDLRSQGWKPRNPPQVFGQSLSSDPYANIFPDESFYLYKCRMFSNQFLPRTESLITLLGNMLAANRYLMPGLSGHQFGSPRTELEVAKMAVKLTEAKIKKNKRWE